MQTKTAVLRKCHYFCIQNIKMSKNRIILFLFPLLVLLSACAQTKVPQPKPSIRTISIIPATDPIEYSLENLSAVQFIIPLAATFNHIDSKNKSKLFNDKIKAQRANLATIFTEDVANALREYGYQVNILNNVVRPVNDVDNIDYKKLNWSSDAVLHLKFTEVGLISTRSSSDYVPRVNINAELVTKEIKDSLYEEDFQWGADASKNTDTEILADSRFSYPDFDTVISNVDVIRAAFELGAHQIGKRVAQQINNSLK